MIRIQRFLSRPGIALAGAVLVLLVAFILRTAGLAGLKIFGDGASSVFFANLQLNQLLSATASDSHPPLYYLLVKLSLAAFGHNEIAARWVSVCAGMLLVALVVATTRRLAGPRLAVGAGLLAAVNPALVYYSRHPRMYALLAFFAFGMLALALSNRRRRSVVIAEGCFAWLALMTHYFAIVPIAAALIWKVSIRLYRARLSVKAEIRRIAIAAAPILAAFVLTIPWLAFALPASLQHTARTISGVPPAENLFAFLASILVFIPNGAFLSLEPSELMAAVVWTLCVVVLFASWRPNRMLACFALLLAGATAIYLVAPAFGRPRFFIVLIPVWIVLITTALALPRRGFRRLAYPAIVVLALAALPPTRWVEFGQFELDAVRLGEMLKSQAADGDLVMLQAWWQAGYFDLHGLHALRYADTRDIQQTDVPRLAAGTNGIWLANFQSPVRLRANGIERWLDDAAYRVDERSIGPTRLVRYIIAPDDPKRAALAFTNGAVLSGSVSARTVRDGGGLPVLLAVATDRQMPDRYVAYIHLVAADGRGWAGRDGEPYDGDSPTDKIRPGEQVVERRGLTVPAGTPEGTYSVRSGLYRRSDGQKLGGAQGDEIELGTVEVVNTPARALLASVTGLADLAEFEIGRADPYAATRTTIQTVDGPQTITTPYDAKPGQTVRVNLLWEPLAAKSGVKVFVHVLDTSGKLIAQHDGEAAEGALPGAGWVPGSRFADSHPISLPADLESGEYRLFAGMYDASGSRLPATFRGNRFAGDLIPLGVLLVGPP